MPEIPLAQVKKALPYGAWERMGGGHYRAVALDVTEGPHMNELLADNDEPYDHYLTPETVHEAINKPCGTCGGEGQQFFPVLRGGRVMNIRPCPTCHGTGSAAPELWELVNRG